MSSRLEIRDLSLAVHLGCTAEERRIVQEVRVSVVLHFDRDPQACTTDRLGDTICYARVCDSLKRGLETGEFDTVERLAEVSESLVREHAPLGIRLEILIHKVKPPVDRLLGGVVFIKETS